MATEETTFRGVILFFEKIGIYDVVLPFLLVFTIVFAILEKTKVFGMEEVEKGVKSTKKSLNSMVAFCVAFLVVLSKQLVATINEAIANVVLLLLVSVCFLILVGSFMKESEEGVFLESPWNWIFMIIMFVGLILIFLHAIPTASGDSNWLNEIYQFLMGQWDTDYVLAVIFVIGIVLYMYFITKPKKVEKKKD